MINVDQVDTIIKLLIQITDALWAIATVVLILTIVHFLKGLFND